MTTAVQAYQFTIDNAVKEWLEQKRTRTGSERTKQAYHDTLREFRLFLQRGELDLLSNPVDVARIAGLWANSRNPDKSRRPNEDVTPSTYNQRLAILSSFYYYNETFWGILKGSLFLEVEPHVSHGRCHRRPAASSRATGGAELGLGRGGFPG